MPKKKPSILIVDPDTHFAEILMKRFQVEGWSARVAKNIEQAKKMLARKSTDLFLVDPEQEVAAEKELSEIMQHSKDQVKSVVIHTMALSQNAQRLWKQSSTSAILRKGEHSLSDFVKKIKKIYTP